MASEGEKVREYKVVLVGSPRVGKTSLIQRYVFNEFSFEVPQTGAEEKKTVELRNGKRVPLRIVDLVDRSDLVTRQYYEDADAVIFVYDVTNPDTLYESRTWIKDIRFYLNEKLSSNMLPVLFVGNKKDLVKNIDYTIGDDPQEGEGHMDYVTLKQAKRHVVDSEKFLLKPIECSANTGEGVNAVFEMIATELIGERKKSSFCVIL